MFETYNVPGLYIAVQAVLALVAGWTAKGTTQKTLTGTVVDSGDGVTHVIPVVDGYVIGSCIKHIPLAGRTMTHFIQQLLRDRGEPVPPEVSLQVAQDIKEQYCYIGQDMLQEYRKFDRDLRFQKYRGIHPRTGKEYTVDVGYEQFLAPELFFNPEMFSSEWRTPLPTVVDSSILACPIDSRRRLYNNIVLSGGSTMFRRFDMRLRDGVKTLVTNRIAENAKKVGASTAGADVEVNVVKHKHQRYAVFFGGSMMATMPEFYSVAHTKAQYEEEGPRIARFNPTFSAGM